MCRVTEIIAPFTDTTYFTDETRDRGTLLHNAYRCYATRIWSFPLPENYHGYMRSFQNWFDEYIVKVVAAEIELRDEKMGFKGHIDLIGQIKGDDFLTVVDWKNGARIPRIWDSQVSAYIHLAKINGYDVRRGGDLQTKADGSRASWVPCDESLTAFNAFHAALQAYRYFKG